jgi:hypothetical protein
VGHQPASSSSSQQPWTWTNSRHVSLGSSKLLAAHLPMGHLQQQQQRLQQQQV